MWHHHSNGKQENAFICSWNVCSTSSLSLSYLKESLCQSTRWPSRRRQGTTPHLRICRSLYPGRSNDPNSLRPGKRTVWYVFGTLQWLKINTGLVLFLINQVIFNYLSIVLDLFLSFKRYFGLFLPTLDRHGPGKNKNTVGLKINTSCVS